MMNTKRFTTKSWINTAVCILFLLPLYWTLTTSVKDRSQIYETPPVLVPRGLDFGNYAKIFTLDDGLYLRYLFNSFTITLLTVLCVCAVSILAGYGFSKLEIWGKGLFMIGILGAIMIPFQALLNPLYSVMSRLGLLNSVLSMILIYATFQTPFCIYMMKNSFDMLPNSLRESAMLEGAGEFRTFTHIFLPLTMPSVATIAVYAAYTTWNDYLIALVFANSNSIKTFNVGLTNLAVGQYGTDWGLLTSSSIIGLLPILLLFIFLQKYFIKGMLSGALK